VAGGEVVDETGNSAGSRAALRAGFLAAAAPARRQTESTRCPRRAISRGLRAVSWLAFLSKPIRFRPRRALPSFLRLLVSFLQ
jgi:hypothetical protein